MKYDTAAGNTGRSPKRLAPVRQIFLIVVDSNRNAVPNAGPGASSSLRRVDDRTLVITDKRDGKVTDTEEFALSTDLKILTMTVHIVGCDKPVVLTFERN